MALTKTAAALQRATEGLTYQSETDTPWSVFHWPGAQGEPTAEAVRQLGRHRATAPVSALSLDEFFAPLIQDQGWYGDQERAEAQKYRELIGEIKRSQQTVHVFRIGRRQVTIYVVGVDPDGGWTGLKTKAVET